jgi:hypothetical protein
MSLADWEGSRPYQKYYIFVQLGFPSNIASDTVTSTDLVEGFSFCTEFKSSQQKSGGSENEVDTSLVKSQLIYFHTEK